MNKILLFFAVQTVIAGCVNCVPEQLKKDNEPPDVVMQSERIVQAIAENDYRKFIENAGENYDISDTRDFAGSIKKMQQNFGEICGTRFLGELKTPFLNNILYAVHFRRKFPDGKNVEHEQLLQLLFSMEKKRYKLIGMRFI